MVIKDALPSRKVKMELHLLDPEGKTLRSAEGDNRDPEFMGMYGSLEYDYMIPLTKRYIFYARVTG